MQLLIFFLFVSLFLASFASCFWQKTLLFLEAGELIIKKEQNSKLLEGHLSYACAQYRTDRILQQLVASSLSPVVRSLGSIEQRYSRVDKSRVEITVTLLVHGKEMGRLRSLQPLFAVY